MNQQVAAIVVTFRSRDLIDQCLQSLLSEGVAQEHIWVVDNASDDHTVEYVQQHYPQVQVISNDENLGFAAANNQALRQVKTAQVLLLNPDAWLAPKALAYMVEAMLQDKSIGVVGPTIMRQNNVEKSLLMRPKCREAWAFLISGMRAFETGGFAGKTVKGFPWKKITDGDHVRGSCMLVRRKAIQGVDLLDENFFLYFEETDWCLRFRNQAWRVIIAPQAVAHHIGKASVKTQGTLPSLEFIRSAILFWKKHMTGIAQIWLRLTLLLLVMAKWVLLLPVASAKARRGWLLHVASLAINPFSLPVIYDKARRPASWRR